MTAGTASEPLDLDAIQARAELAGTLYPSTDVAGMGYAIADDDTQEVIHTGTFDDLIPTVCTDAVALVAEARQLQARVTELEDLLQAAVEDKLLEATLMRELTTQGGKLHLALQPARELAALWVGACRGLLGDAENYSETKIGFHNGTEDPTDAVDIDIDRAEEAEWFTVRIQRTGKLTPHEARELAEKRAETAEARVAELEAELARTREA